MTLSDIIAWIKGKEKIGNILTIGEDCYWEHELTGCVKSFNQVTKIDLVINPNQKQMAAHVYKVEAICKKEYPEDPIRFYVKQFDIIELSKLEQWKEELTKSPYL